MTLYINILYISMCNLIQWHACDILIYCKLYICKYHKLLCFINLHQVLTSAIIWILTFDFSGSYNSDTRHNYLLLC